MRFKKIYLEISNVCNLSCSFCHKTVRKPRIMNYDEFKSVLPKLRKYTDYLYFHLMGEPLCHPDLARFLEHAGELGFKVIPSSANFLFAESEKIGGEELYLALKSRGILVRHFKKERIKNFNRITIGTIDEMRAFVDAVKNILKDRV